MKALVVYESMFGNTKAVAGAIAEGLAERLDVDLRDLSQAPPEVMGLVDLIVVGGPTHAFSMSRPSTRLSAVEKGATGGSKETGLRDWLGQLGSSAHSELVATFDTRVYKARRLPGSAAAKAAKVALALGYAPAGRNSFYVADTCGPLLPGELERARAWGVRLALEMHQRMQVGR